MIITRVFAAASICASALASPVEKRAVSFKWGSEKLRGVNVGGWLVLEPWITPSIFEAANQNRGTKDIVDEYTLTEKLGKDAALSILRKHWDSFARYEDFKKIKDSGFNLVRLPVGFWSYDNLGTPYTDGAAPYVDSAIDWARGLGLKIIIDLHGAQGSQNGYDNSGQRLDRPGWQNGDNVKKTLEVLNTISKKYAKKEYQDVIIGIQLLNEPALYFDNMSWDVTKQFYRDGYYQVRNVSDTVVIIHDGFKAPNNWNAYLTPKDGNAQNVAIDHHEYQVFNVDQLRKSPLEHLQYTCSNSESYNGADKWTFIGEWSAALTDCAKYLNGYGRGARYDGTYLSDNKIGECGPESDLSKWNQTYKDDTRKYLEAQIAAYEKKTQGWIFWNFKTEGAAEWDAFKLVDAGVFPTISGGKVDFKFTAIC